MKPHTNNVKIYKNTGEIKCMLNINNKNILYEIFCDFSEPIKGIMLKARKGNYFKPEFYTYTDNFNWKAGFSRIYDFDALNNILNKIENHGKNHIQIILIPSNTNERDWRIKTEQVENALEYPFIESYDRNEIEQTLKNIFEGGFIERKNKISYNTIVQTNADKFKDEKSCIQKGIDGFEIARYSLETGEKHVVKYNKPTPEIIEVGEKEILTFKDFIKIKNPDLNPILQYFDIQTEPILNLINKHLGSKAYNVQLIDSKKVFVQYTDGQTEMIGYDVQIDVSPLPISKLVSLARYFLSNIQEQFEKQTTKIHLSKFAPVFEMQLKIEPNLLSLAFEISTNELIETGYDAFKPIVKIQENYSSIADLNYQLKVWKNLYQTVSKREAILRNLDDLSKLLQIEEPKPNKPLVYISQIQNYNIIKIGRIVEWSNAVMLQNYDEKCRELHNPAVLQYYFYTPKTNDNLVNAYLYRCCKDVIKNCCNDLKQRKDLGEDFYECNNIPTIIKAAKEIFEVMTYKELVAIRPKYKRKIFAESKDNLDANIYKPETIIEMINQLDTIDLPITTELNIF